MSPAKEKSFDYPLMAREFLKTSWITGACKLPAGLYIVATPIGNLGDISLRALTTLATANRVATEDTRVSGGMLAKYGIKKPLIPYHDHNALSAGEKIIGLIKSGEAIALISDAGMPLISDPGFRLVEASVKEGIAVTVIPGANAALTALAGSGLATDQFHFAGFLPPKTAARQKGLAGLAAIPGTLIFYESPQRLAACLADMAKIFGADRQAVVARELTKLFEDMRRGSLNELAEFYAGQNVKGEIVLLVAPAAEGAAHNAEDMETMLKQALKIQSLRDAVHSVSEATGKKKSEVYNLALRLSAHDKT